MKTLEKNRPIVEDSRKIQELYVQLNEVIGVDDNKEDWEYSDEEIISEAKYVKSQFDGGIGFDYEEILAGEYGTDEERKFLRKQYNQIKRFLKKWGNK